MAQQKPSTSQNLHTELKALADTLDEVLHSTTEKSEAELKQLKAKAEEMLKSTRQTLTSAGEKLVDQTKEIAERTDNYVHEKPWNGMGIAAAVGVVIGVLLARR